MYLKTIVDEDFVNYKEPSMFIITPLCDWKCCTAAEPDLCQNRHLENTPNIWIDNNLLCERYLKNSITKAIVFGGLEPFMLRADIVDFVWTLRRKYHCDDTVIIYTGYTEQEVKSRFKTTLDELRYFKNTIIKLGRYIPNQQPHHDELLGINLASDNQYAVRIEDL